MLRISGKVLLELVPKWMVKRWQSIVLKVGKHLSSIEMETVKIIMTTAAAT